MKTTTVASQTAEVTSEMVRAGIEAMIGFNEDFETRASLVEAIFRAMAEVQQAFCRGNIPHVAASQNGTKTAMPALPEGYIYDAKECKIVICDTRTRICATVRGGPFEAAHTALEMLLAAVQRYSLPQLDKEASQ